MKVVICFFFLALLSGCFSSERNNLQDPVNTPILEIGDVAYANDVGRVDVSWSYIGQGPISEFIIQRRISGPFEQVGKLSGIPAGQFARRVFSFFDESLPAGERLFYRISVPVEGQLPSRTDARAVTVPGARLEAVTPNSTDGSIRVSWRASEDVTSVEVYRLVDDQPELIFQTDNIRTRSFVDHGLMGDQTYGYIVRSQLPGVSLTSLPGEGAFYPSAGTTRAGFASNQSEKSFLLIPKLTSTSNLNVYHHGQNATMEHRYSVSRWGGAGALSPSRSSPSAHEDRELDPTTLSVDTPGRDLRITVNTDLGRFEASVGLYTSGISSRTGEIVLNANVSSVIGASRRWIDLTASKTSLSTDFAWGTIYLGAGLTMHVLDGDFTDVGDFELPAEPSGLEAQGTRLWLSARDPGRLFLADVTRAGSVPSAFSWSEVDLPAGSDPVAVASSRSGQTFVLDDGLSRIHVLSSVGDLKYHWNLPNRPFDRGDIAVTGRDEVFALDNEGTIHGYRP